MSSENATLLGSQGNAGLCLEFRKCILLMLVSVSDLAGSDTKVLVGEVAFNKCTIVVCNTKVALQGGVSLSNKRKT